MTKLKRTYIDVHGNRREVIFHSLVPFLVPYMKGYSPAERWLLDGHMIMIPTKAWELVKIIGDEDVRE